MLYLTIIMVVVGLVLMYSASYANGIYYAGDGFYYVKRQAFFAVVGVLFMVGISYFKYEWLHQLSWVFFGLSYLLLCMTLLMSPINNSKRWIIIGGFTFQPSELIKFAIILLFSHLISLDFKRMKDFNHGCLRFLLIYGAVAFIMLMQPHISGLIIITILAFMMMLIGGTQFKYLFRIAAVVVPIVVLIIYTSDTYRYAVERVVTKFFGGDSSSTSYQVEQALIAIGSGGFWGQGLGNSRQKMMYVPEAQNDFVFSIICEELGFVGAVIIIAMFTFFVFKGISIALHCKDKFGSLLAFGVTFQIGLQAILNFGVVTSILPNTGISLPFFSQGGTSLFILLCEVGVLLSVSRYSKINNKSEVAIQEGE